MSLPRKEVRVFFDHDDHAVLSAICANRGVTLAEFCEAYIAGKIKRIEHESMLVVAASKANRRSRSVTESSGVAPQYDPNEQTMDGNVA